MYRRIPLAVALLDEGSEPVHVGQHQGNKSGSEGQMYRRIPLAIALIDEASAPVQRQAKPS